MIPAEVAAFLELSDERDRWHNLCLDYWRAGFAAGAAWQERQEPQPICEQLDFDQPGDWPARALGPLPRIDPQLDCIRYPPHGRKRFGEPRPGDFHGRRPVAPVVPLAGRAVRGFRDAIAQLLQADPGDRARACWQAAHTAGWARVQYERAEAAQMESANRVGLLADLGETACRDLISGGYAAGADRPAEVARG